MIWQNIRATRIVAFVSGDWAGWLGLYHGCFEISLSLLAIPTGFAYDTRINSSQASLINE